MKYTEMLEEEKNNYKAWRPWLTPQELDRKAVTAAKKRFCQKNKRTLTKKYVGSIDHNRFSGKPDVEIYDESGNLDVDESLRLENKVKGFWFSDWSKVVSFCQENNITLKAGNAAGKYTD